METDIYTSQGLSSSTVPRKVLILADRLSKLHGPAVIRNESNGYHIYVACPECLETDGRKELSSKHLTINASKHEELEEWVLSHPDEAKKHDKDFSAVCHKNTISFRVSDLVNKHMYPPLEQRKHPGITSHVVTNAVLKQDCLVQDAKGNWIPQDPGTIVPITELPPNHPAAEYLLARGYDLELLLRQFNCSYCTAENPENPNKGIYYKKLPLNFKDTPQGRIIFFAYINGVQVGWQARIIERTYKMTEHTTVKEYWHPYENRWVTTEYKDPETGKFKAFPYAEVHTDKYDLIWSPSKYKTAFGMSRNEALMGVDAAVKWNKVLSLVKPTGILVEGPLDAARFGPGGIAMLGKYLSDKQADILARKFRRLLMVMDNDKAGEEARQRIKQVMADKLTEIIFVDVPAEYKDAGEMTTFDALKMIHKNLF